MPRYKVNLDELAPTLRWVAKLAVTNSLKAVRQSAAHGKVVVRHTITRTRDPFRIRATGEFESPDNWDVQETPNGAILSPTSFHSLFVERGRPPGRKPPYDAILQWAYRKKIGLRRTTNLRYTQLGTRRTQAIVKAIQWNIAKKGTKGRWPLKRTLPRIAKHLAKEMKKAMDASIGKKPPTRGKRRKSLKA